MKSSQKRPIPFWKHPFKKWLVFGYTSTFIMYILGFILEYSLILDNGLSRFGALVIMIGVFITWKDVRGSFKKTNEMMAEIFADSNEPYCHKSAEIRDKKFSDMEAIIIASGTFVWGFGDLIFKTIGCAT